MDNGKQDPSGEGSDKHVQAPSPNSMMDLTFSSQNLISSAASCTSSTFDLILPISSVESSSNNGNQSVASTRFDHASETSDSIDRIASAGSSLGVETLETIDERTLHQRSQQIERRGKEELEGGPETREEGQRAQKRKCEDQEEIENGGSPSREKSIGTKDEQISCNSEAQDLRFLQENEDHRESLEEILRRKRNARARRHRQEKKEKRKNIMDGDDMAKKMSLQAEMEQQRLRHNDLQRKIYWRKKEEQEMLEREEILEKLGMYLNARN
ncbi:32afbe69-a3a1-42bb-b625-3c81e4fc38b9 [Sclerotinia trifoliorum]|uniref:32afbe69-a3a1-42bb-b625-3c81e4fc38b9 n=1 Tax=Sclerotinia trifoliorum TaxID=28548 RepID=A0A8H2VKL9_9HELO|nr:32afbe69-a3a1-42bb-b625-3c81e4fc38b9 [Sclerotinia trifoliorum]